MLITLAILSATLLAHTPETPFCTSATRMRRKTFPVQIGGSARGYQAIFVPSAALGSPGYDGQPAVYLYIAALEVNVLNCRESRGCSG
jgi:hypothetical protein